MRISQHISTLLFSYDCVIIPGLGGFVANQAPAKIQPDKHLASPPSKGIIFNKNLTSNDGLLTDYIARSEGIPYSDARQKITSFVGHCLERLSSGERIVFDELGVLYYDKEKNIQFQPDFSLNFLVESFGLVPVVAHPVTKEIPGEEKEEATLVPVEIQNREPEKDSAIIRNIGKKSFARKYWPAAAALIPLAFYSFWIPLRTDYLKTGQLELSDFNPFHRTISTSFTGRKTKFQLTAPVEENHEWEQLIATSGGPVAKLHLGEENENFLNVYVIPTIPESTFVSKTVRETSTGKHHIIAGCFRELSNAEQMVTDLQEKGYAARILDTHNGLHRVTAASYITKEDALSGLRKIRGDAQPAAWLLSK